jgi:D-sedoheptulose 7-phosphate isomerase
VRGVSVQTSYVRYLAGLDALLKAVDTAALERIVQRLRDTAEEGGTIFIGGNGGSAATATHWVNDLGKATRHPDCPPMRVYCLSDSVSWLTALANDEGYENSFSGQLENFVRPGDLLAVISCSGNSPNLVRAVEVARERGAATIALLGFDGGALLRLVDDAVWLESEHGAYGLVETAHSVLCDVITSCLIAERAARTGAVATSPT